MAESHLLAMASVRENYGFVYIEAMSQACVPLAVANPVQREIIGDGGILVPESTPAAIAEGLAPAFEAVWLRSKAEHALRRFQQVHAPQRVASRIRDVVAGAIGR